MCDWLEANHTYFHVANIFLALTYFCPNNLKGLIALRLCLGTAGVFFALWGVIILCSPEYIRMESCIRCDQLWPCCLSLVHHAANQIFKRA